ncbi:MAG: NADH-quinone oxidoreductase subunit J [Opitutaceae bacterium]
MTDILFYFFAVLAIVCALLVVFSRNAVNAAMFLIVSFLSMAALFVLLGAYFLAVLQVLVYAGAVVVLFLFIIMLLDVKGGKRHSFRPVTALASALALALMVGATVLFFSPRNLPSSDAPVVAAGSSLKAYGEQLFTTYLLPMQVTGFLLLVAMIGVIVLSKQVRPVGRGD